MNTNAHTGTTTPKLTGSRFTAVEGFGTDLAGADGQVLFCEKVGGEYQLSRYPGRHLQGHDIGQRSAWLGTFGNTDHYQVGRVVVVSALRWDAERCRDRFAVRLVDETRAEFMQAAWATEGDRS
jgi:hypothetical protein